MHARETVSPAVEAGVRALRGGGRPLPEPVRQRLERSSGKRLAHVRVHDGPLAHSMAAAVGAQAFTTGGTVALGSGGGGPGVLAHELSHAVQQAATPEQGSLSPTHAGDAVEKDASA